MAKVIEFYVPRNFAKRLRSDPPLQCGKLIEFCLPTNESAEFSPSLFWRLARSWKGDEGWIFNAQ
jgi:hypothetical protein